MKHKMLYPCLASFLFVLVSAGIAIAHDVKIDLGAKLGNGPEMQPGTYRVELLKNQNAPEAVFYKGRSEVARVPITIAMESEKSRHTEVHYELLDDGRVINQIKIAGWKERLVFRERGPAPTVTE
jgi:hypothetical protein